MFNVFSPFTAKYILTYVSFSMCVYSPPSVFTGTANLHEHSVFTEGSNQFSLLDALHSV